MLRRQETLVPLRVVVDALTDVLVDYNVPATRVVSEFQQTLAVYMDPVYMEASE